MKIAILASDDQGNYYSVACENDDAAIDALRDEIEECGWDVRGQVISVTATGFRKIAKRNWRETIMPEPYEPTEEELQAAWKAAHEMSVNLANDVLVAILVAARNAASDQR